MNRTQQVLSPSHPLTSLVLASALLAACSSSSSGSGDGDSQNGGSGSGEGEEGAERPSNHEESLEALGVDQTASPRLDEYGNPIPEDYSPLGSRFRMDPLSELWIGGVRLDGSDAVATLLEDVAENPADVDDVYDPEVLFALSEEDAPWMEEDLSSGTHPESRRAATAADLDGDGQEELVTVFHEEDRLEALVVERTEGRYALDEQVLLFNQPDVIDVSVAAGDFDGDQDDDLVVAYVLPNEAWIFIAGADETGQILPHTMSSQVFLSNFSGSSIELVLETGNLDFDNSEELVVLVNERGRGSVPTITTRYHVIDDRASGYAELDWGFVEGFVEDQGLHVASIADVALGDVDGDHRDEILFGGLEAFVSDCNSVPYFVVALDDAPSGFEPIAAETFTRSYECDAFDPQQLRFAFVNALDIDGDGRDEVQVNDRTFDDFSDSDPWTVVEEWSLPKTAFLDNDLGTFLGQANCAFAKGDYNADGNADLFMWRSGTGEVRVYGRDEDGDVVQLGRIPTDTGVFRGFQNPILVGVDADLDAPVFESVPQEEGEGFGEFVFLEPIVLAVLAAPPCREGIGQNTEACQTTFGNTASSGNAQELTVSYTASASIGFNVDGGAVAQSEVEAKATFTTTISSIVGRSYEVEKTISFTTGPNEDTVVFTTVPIDRFAYRVLYHPDPTMIEKVIRVALPREPIFLQVERGFYNDHVVDDGLKIDDGIFEHQIGDPSSYPTPSEKDALLAQYGGLEIGPQAVGQGAGETELELAVSEEYDVGGALELGFEIEAEVTAGTVLAGFTVGASTESELLVTSGSSTTYTGTVGSLAGPDFLDHRYSFGMFTYVQLDPDTRQEFEVVNYWVE